MTPTLSPNQWQILQFVVDFAKANWSTTPRGPGAGAITSLLRAGLVERVTERVSEGGRIEYTATAAGQITLARHAAMDALPTRTAYEATEYRGWRITFDCTSPLGTMAIIAGLGGVLRSAVGGGDTSDSALLTRAWDAIDRAIAEASAEVTPSPAPPAPGRRPIPGP